MRSSVIVLTALIWIGLSSCRGPLVEQPPAQQAAADALHQRIMEHTRLYRSEAGVKVMAACVAWRDQGIVSVSGLNWYYYPTRWAMRNRSIPNLQRAAIGECESSAGSDNAGCNCQVIDVNGRNAIAAPNSVSSPAIDLVFMRDTVRTETRPQDRQSKPATPQAQLESRAGPISTQGEFDGTGELLTHPNTKVPSTPLEKLESRAGKAGTSQ